MCCAMSTDAGANASRFATVRVAGPDAAAFLQGYLTADLDGLEADRALPMAYCNLKGRVLASGWAAGTATDVLLLVDASVAPRLAAELGKYLLFSKAKLAPAPAGLAFAKGSSASAVALPPTHFHVRFGDGDNGHEAFANASVEADFVVVAEPVAERFLPQMIGLTAAGAVSFSKGCYLGQEVVARAEHRGEVKQKLARFAVDGDAPAVGTDVVVDGKKAGVVVAVAPGVALASVRGLPNGATAGSCRLRAEAAA